MNEPLYVSPGGVTSLSDVHDRVAGAMSQLMRETPDVGALQRAYGTISAAFISAMGQALPERAASLRATGAASQDIGDMLREAARRYEQGDREGADGLGAAAGGSAPEPMGQLTGQVQQVGQIAQGVAQSMQGLAQGLAQLPQQLAQGVQSAVQATAAHDEPRSARRSLRDTDFESDEDDRDEPRETREHDDHRKERHAPPVHAEAAPPGQAGVRAPVSPPPVDRPQPAQTRPQQAAP